MTYGERVLDIRYVSFFYSAFIGNISRSDKHLASYAQHARRSSYEVSVIIN
jgi:hypothetical protein